MMQENFAISVDLQSEIIMDGTTLDGLIAGVLVENGMDIEEAHKSIPIKCIDGLFHASCVRFDGEVAKRRQTFIASLRATHNIPLELVRQKKNGGPHRQINVQRRSDFGNIMNIYEAKFCKTISWVAQGDPEHVLSILEGVILIGKRRGSGYGQVQNWRLSECNEDGLVGPDGFPLRPIPLEMWGGDSSAVRADVAWRPAYWREENRAICVVPNSMAGVKK